MIIHNAKLFKLMRFLPWLSKIFTATDGYIEEKEKGTDYWMGQQKIVKQVLREDGQWLNFTPLDELQAGRRVDTMGCTGYGFNNVKEMLSKVIWDLTNNDSDRYTNKVTGTTSRGNGMVNVMDKVRKNYGWVSEETYPWDRNTFTWAKYYSTVPHKILLTGQAKLKEYVLNYERVPTNVSLMKEGLKYSPLYVAGFAWYRQGELYRSYGKANHAFTIVGYVDGSHWWAYDSYSPHLKKLAWDYKFGACFVITINKKDKEFDIAKLEHLLKRGYEYIMRVEKINGASGQVYRVTKAGLVELSEQEKKEIGIRALHDKADLTGISELDFTNLYK